MENPAKILFVCTANRLRSKTAETIFQGLEGVEVRSAGTDIEANTQVNRDLLEWADRIFVMEKRHRNWIGKKFRDIYKSKSITCLYIPDEYDYMDPALVELLQEKMKAYLPGDLE